MPVSQSSRPTAPLAMGWAAWSLLLISCGGDAPTAMNPPPSSGWATVASMPTQRLGLAAVTVNGRVYVVGGYPQANGAGSPVLEMFDPVSGAWSARAPMPTGRRWLAAAVVNGKIYAIGGHAGTGAPGLQSVQEYDPATDSWATRSAMPTGRLGVAAAALGGKIYAVGGTSDNVTPLATVEEYDPATDTWTPRQDMPTARAVLALFATGGKLYAMGGGPDPDTGSPTVEIYDPVSGTWSNGPDMPTSRAALCGAVVNGRIYVTGGRHSGVAYHVVESLDPVQGTWRQEPDMAVARWGLSCAAADAKLFAIGGAAQLQPPHAGLKTVEAFEPATAVPVSSRGHYAGTRRDREMASVAVRGAFTSTEKGPAPDPPGDCPVYIATAWSGQLSHFGTFKARGTTCATPTGPPAQVPPFWNHPPAPPYLVATFTTRNKWEFPDGTQLRSRTQDGVFVQSLANGATSVRGRIVIEGLTGRLAGAKGVLEASGGPPAGQEADHLKFEGTIEIP